MLFSVIILTHQRTRPLSHALSSLLTQTYQTWEAIVVDHTTGDEIAQSLIPLRASDRRIRHLPHTSLASPMHMRLAGIQAARGDILCFLEENDYFAPTHLETHKHFFDTHPRVDVVQGKPLILGSLYHDTPTSHTAHLHHSPLDRTLFFRDHVRDTHDFHLTTHAHHYHHFSELMRDHGFVAQHIHMPTYIHDRSEI